MLILKEAALSVFAAVLSLREIGFWVFAVILWLMIGRQFVKMKAVAYEAWKSRSCKLDVFYRLFFFPISTAFFPTDGLPCDWFGLDTTVGTWGIILFWPFSFVWFLAKMALYLLIFFVAACVHIIYGMAMDIWAGLKRLIPEI